jgi:hypothetical protein
MSPEQVQGKEKILYKTVSLSKHLFLSKVNQLSHVDINENENPAVKFIDNIFGLVHFIFERQLHASWIDFTAHSARTASVTGDHRLSGGPPFARLAAQNLFGAGDLQHHFVKCDVCEVLALCDLEIVELRKVSPNTRVIHASAPA